MVRPNLNDLVARVIRDPIRKLGYDDRLYGTMRLALRYGIEPVNLAGGGGGGPVIAAASGDGQGGGSPASRWGAAQRAVPGALLKSIWAGQRDGLEDRLVRLTWEAMGRFVNVA